MVSSYRIIGLGLLVAFIVLAFTFGTSLLAAGVENYSLAISVAFIMGGLFSICLSGVLKIVTNHEEKASAQKSTDE